MDLTLRYCPARRKIEEDFAALANRLFRLTERLNLSIGQHQAFRTAKLDCEEVHHRLAELKLALKNHRAAHKC